MAQASGGGAVNVQGGATSAMLFGELLLCLGRGAPLASCMASRS